MTCLIGVPRRSSFCSSLAGKVSCQEVYQVTFTFSPTVFMMFSRNDVQHGYTGGLNFRIGEVFT